MKAIILVVLAYLSVAIMSTFVKVATQYLPASEVLFSRFAIGLVFLLPIIYKAKLLSIKTNNIKFYLLRNISGLIGMALLFVSLKHIPVATSVLFINTASLFVPVFMLLLFKERTSLPVLICTLIGFVGVLIIVLPAFSLGHNHIYLIFGVLSAVFAAFAYIGIKKLSAYDAPLKIIFNFYLMSIIIIPIFTAYHWLLPSYYQLGLLVMVGLFGLLFQIFMNYALKYANITVITPFIFTGVLFAGLLDWVVWGLVPSVSFWLGFVIIAAAISVLVRVKSASS